MTREEVLEKYQNGYTDYESEEFYKILSDIFLESSSPKELVDKAFRSFGSNNLGHLRDEVYDLPIEGYKNLYDYICSLDYIKKVAVPDSYKQRKEYKDITLKRLGIRGLSIPINTELLYSINPATGKIIIDEFLDQLKEVIEEEELGLTNSDFVYIDSIRLAKDLYQKGLIKELRKCTEDVLFQVVDDENNKTVIDILVENDYIYALPIAGVRWRSGEVRDPKYYILDKIIPSLNKTVFEFLLDKNYIKCFYFDDYQQNIAYCKKMLRKACEIGRVDLLNNIPCEILRWKYDEDDPNSVDYYTVLKNNSIKFTGDIKDPRVAYDYLTDDSPKLEDFLWNCNFDTFKSKYKDDNNETIATLFFSILATKTEEEKNYIFKFLYGRGWIDEEVITAALYSGIFIPVSNRSFNDVYVGINANHVLDYDIYDGDMKERYEFNVDYLSAEFLKAYENDSDENTLNAILTSYFAYKETNPVEAQKELKLLIDLKKNRPSFNIISDTIGSGVFEIFGAVTKLHIMNYFSLSVINHELAHILFYTMLADETKDLESLLPDIKDVNIQNDCFEVGVMIKSIISLPNRKKKYESEFEKYIESRFGSVENYKSIMREEYKALIGDPQLLADYLVNDMFARETIKVLLNAVFENKEKYTEEQAINYYIQGRYISEEILFINKSFSRDFESLLIYENFMDAYYGGLLNTIYKTKLKDRNDYPKSTHNEGYFSNNKSRINEMFADFVALKKQALREEKSLDKSKDPFNSAYYYLNLIRKNCGEEVYNGLELLYKKALDKIQLDEEITIQDSKRV